MLALRVNLLRFAGDFPAVSNGTSKLFFEPTMRYPGHELQQSMVCASPTFTMQRRTRTKINFQHPHAPPERKRRMLHATKPFFIPRKRPVNESCVNLMPRSESFPLNPLEFLLAKQAREVIAAAKIVVLAHTNPTPINTWKTYKNKVWKQNIRLWSDFDNRVLKEAVMGTKYDVMRPFIEKDCVETILITAADLNFGALVKGLKFFSSYVPLLVIVEGNHVVSYPQLQTFAKTLKSGIIGLHAATSASLSSPLSALSQNIQHPYWMLSQSLQYIANPEK